MKFRSWTGRADGPCPIGQVLGDPVQGGAQLGPVDGLQDGRPCEDFQSADARVLSSDKGASSAVTAHEVEFIVVVAFAVLED